MLSTLKERCKLHPLKVHNIYLFGSRIYGISTDKSDYDFMIVANNSVENIEHKVVKDGIEFNFHIVTPDYFKERLDWNDPKMIECVLWSNQYEPILEKIKYEVKIDNPKYRHAVSHISSNSFVKAKKKIEVENDIYIGQKSLYHSIRIPMYAIQVVNHNKIVDWSVANAYWYDIKSISDWNILKEKYTPIRNAIMTEFRKICEKE